MTVIENQRSMALRIKGAIGHRAWRVATRPAAWSLRRMPLAMLYRIGLGLRRNSWPYSTVREGDTVLQIGAPSDLLHVGRSRAVYFAMLVGKTGRLYVFEPEPQSAAAMQDYLRRAGLADRVRIVAKGCWSENRTLRFWSNPRHPASNLLEDVSEWSEFELRTRGYRPSEVSVTTVDEVLNDEGRIRLVSVTTNGSEKEILAGARETLKRTGYLALADTGPEIRALSERFGFQNVASDDRGFTSVRAGM